MNEVIVGLACVNAANAVYTVLVYWEEVQYGGIHIASTVLRLSE